MKIIKKYLLSKEWSLGNSQCPECHGFGSGWITYTGYININQIGHNKKCILAKILKKLKLKPVYKGKKE